MTLPNSPIVQQLKAWKAACAAADPARWADAGLPVGQIMSFRIARNRKTPTSYRPCITFIFVTDSAVPTDLNQNQDEKQRNATIDLQADVELPPEVANEDETGLDLLSKLLAVAMNIGREALVDVKCDWIEDGELDPEDRATPDDGRLVREAIVVYRVLQDDANVLLAQGADQ